MDISRSKRELLKQLNRVPMDRALRGAVSAGIKRMDDDEASRRAEKLRGALNGVPKLNAEARRVLDAIKNERVESASATEDERKEKAKALEAGSSAR